MQFDEDDEDDVKKDDLDVKCMVYDVHEMRTKLVIVSEVFLMKHIIKDVPHMCLRRILELMGLILMFLYFR